MHGPVAYTDGACLGNPGPGGWGVRILHADGTVCELGGRVAATTNNRMELQAAIAALQALHTPPQVAIFSDSRYVIDGLTKWLHAWRRRGWLTSTNTPVKNQDLWERLDAAATRHKIQWHWVKGHSGDEGNELADQLANQGVDEVLGTAANV